LYEADIDTLKLIDLLQSSPLFTAELHYKIEQLEDKDWEREWMDNFHPMQFGHRLWVCPSWRDIPDPNAVNVMLDPGLAFVLCLTITLGQNYEAFLQDNIDWNGAIATYIGIPLFLVIMFSYKLFKKTKWIKYQDMDFSRIND